jgi:CYTH domain-containing protein
MPHRRFLVSSALARLIEREQGAGLPIVEGFFPPRPDRRQVVRLEGDEASLVLVTTAEGADPVEEPAGVPRAHVEALLDVAPGQVAYGRIGVPVSDDASGLLHRFTTPGRIDILSVGFADEDAARTFVPPAWAGLEVTGDAAFRTDAIALDGLPAQTDVEPSNAAIDALLDTLDRPVELRPVLVDAAPDDEEEPAQTRVEVERTAARLVSDLSDLLGTRRRAG